MAALVCMCLPAAASADVLELAHDGAVKVLVSDTGQGSPATTDPAPSNLTDLPDEAVTVVMSSVAPVAFAPTVEQLSELNHISPALLEALVWQESRWRTVARSSAGAIGLAQLMPGTARDLGVNPHDPNANLAGGARYLRQQLDRFDGDIELALAAYNAGPGRVLRAGRIPEIAETKNYVRSIVDRLSRHPVSEGSRP